MEIVCRVAGSASGLAWMTDSAVNQRNDRLAMYRRVAELHAANLDHGFLASLGPRFLALMYQAIDEAPDSVLIVARTDADDIVGFVAGGGGIGAIYRHMLRYWWRLCVSLALVLMSPRKLRRILEILRYGGSQPDAFSEVSSVIPKAELLSIAVDAAHRGKGHAEQLYRDLQRHFRNRGEPGFRIVVGAALVGAHRFYQRMGARAVAQIEVHRGERSMLYVHALN